MSALPEELLTSSDATLTPFTGSYNAQAPSVFGPFVVPQVGFGLGQGVLAELVKLTIPDVVLKYGVPTMLQVTVSNIEFRVVGQVL